MQAKEISNDCFDNFFPKYGSIMQLLQTGPTEKHFKC